MFDVRYVYQGFVTQLCIDHLYSESPLFFCIFYTIFVHNNFRRMNDNCRAQRTRIR
jgi:hypothetical protein